MTTFRFGALTLDASEFGSQGSAVLGIRDSGKTYTATGLAEGLYEAGVPFIAFDPIGVWRFLQVPGAHKGGRGYPVVVAGGMAGDLPLTPQSAPAIVEAAMHEGVSLVIDLFHIDLSKADWRKIVKNCVRLLLHKNKPHGLRHIFLEEAAEFAPQKVLDGEVYAEIEKLARMGGNSGLGYTLINQRSQEVNKAVLELCDNLFLHRQRGKNAIDSLDKWLSIAGTEGKEIIKSLPALPQGQCWAWIGGDKPAPPQLIQVPRKHSMHPDRRVMRGEDAAVQAKAVDVGSFVAQLQAALPALEEEVAANDPAKLRARIKELEREAASLQALTDCQPIDPAMFEAAYEDGFRAGRAEGVRHGQAVMLTRCQEAVRAVRLDEGEGGLGLASVTKVGRIAAFEAEPIKPTLELGFVTSRTQAQRIAASFLAPTPKGDPSVETDVLRALSEFAALGVLNPTRELVAMMCGYANIKSAKIAKAFAALTDAGLLRSADGELVLTPKGHAVAPEAPPVMSPDGMRSRIVTILGPPSDKILSLLMDAYPGALARADVASEVGYSNIKSAAFAGAVAKLVRMGFVEARDTRLVAADKLFPSAKRRAS